MAQRAGRKASLKNRRLEGTGAFDEHDMFIGPLLVMHEASKVRIYEDAGTQMRPLDLGTAFAELAAINVSDHNAFVLAIDHDLVANSRLVVVRVPHVPSNVLVNGGPSRTTLDIARRSRPVRSTWS